MHSRPMFMDRPECPGREGGMMQRVAQIAWPKANRITVYAGRLWFAGVSLLPSLEKS